MIKIILLLFLSSCYYKDKLINFFYKGTSINYNEIKYEVKRSIRVNDTEIFQKDFELIKNPKKEKLVLRDKEGNLLLTLENKKLIFKDAKEEIPFTANKLNEIVYYVFLYPSFDLEELLNLLNIHSFHQNNENDEIIKISFDKGYFIYNTRNKTLKKLSFIIEEKNKVIENTICFDYKDFNNNLLLKKFKLEIKVDENIIIMEENLVRGTLKIS